MSIRSSRLDRCLPASAPLLKLLASQALGSDGSIRRETDEAPRSGVFSVAQGVVRTIDVDRRDAVVTQEAMDWDGEDENPIFHPPDLGAAMTQIDEDVDLMTDEELAARADARLLAELPEGWDFHEVGGSGDCAFRAIAWALSRAQNKKIEDPEALQREAARLRLLSVGHIGNHAPRFSESWAADPEESKSDRAGQTSPITTFAEYKEAAAGRHFYADGIMLQALSERIACPLVAWAWNPELDMWNRSVIAPWFTSDSTAGVGKKGSPLVLALRGKHCRALESSSSSGGNIPTAWLRQTSARPRAEFRGGGNRQSPTLSGKTKVSLSGGLSLPSSTPIELLLRPLACRSPAPLPLSQGSGSLSSRGFSRGECSGPQARCFSSPDPVSLPHGASGEVRALRGLQFGQGSRCPPREEAPKRARQAPPGSERSKCPSSAPARPASRPRRAGSTEAPTETTEQDGIPRSHVIRHKRKCQDQKATEGRILWWTREVEGCGFRVFRHLLLKNHSYHRKRHLSNAHGIPWNEIPAFKPDDTAEPKQAPFNGKALFMKVRWENAWKLFHEAKWPGAHRVPCEMDASSGHGNPFHRCSRCKELVRRSQLHATRCSKDSSKKSGPTPKRRAQLWKGWFKAASVAAKAACKEAKKARDTRSDASETSRLRRQSAARLLSASEVAKCTKCGHLVSRDHLPVERCPAAKAKAFPALKARQAEWPRSWLRMLAASGAVSRLCRRRDSAAGSFW